MTESKHTPGEWQYEPDISEDANGCEYVAGWNVFSETSPGEFFEIVGCEGIYDGESAEANARLIAASPKLLKALEDFLCHCPSGVSPMLDEAKISARAAIKEAKGE